MKKVVISLTLSAFLSGCVVGPNYEPPITPIPDVWNSEPAPCVNLTPEPPPIAWWQLFQDRMLEKYIEMAASYNNTLMAAEASICQARAMRRVAASDLFPHASADANATRTYFSKNGPVFAFVPGGQDPNSVSTGLPFQIQIPQIQNLYNALIDASWEIDIFGKRIRNIQVADANIGSTIEQRNDILITILAEVAINYIELRSLQQMGVLITQNIDFWEHNAAIIDKRVQVGYSNHLDFDLAAAETFTAAANLPTIYAQIYQNIYALSVLTGNLPETLLAELLPIQPLPVLPCEIAVGIRSDVLRRRPDVRRAERQLAAAVANVGVAVASFFPTFTLIGDIGFQSLSINNLFQGRSLTWAIEGAFHMPIFQGGKLIGDLQSSEAQAASATYTYQQTVLAALQDAESRIAGYTQALQTTDQYAKAAAAYTDTLFLTQERFQKGLISLIDVLTIELQWNTAEQNLLSSQTNALIDLVTLYKALGGGWEPLPDCPEC